MEESILSLKLKAYRVEHSLTQQDLAEMLEVSDKSISKWELGKTYPSKKNIIKISELLNISMELLLLEEVVEDNQKEKRITKYVIPLLMVGIFVTIVFNFIHLKTIKNQSLQMNTQEKKLTQQQIELDKLYTYTVYIVLAPKTPYTDFKEYIEENYKVDSIHVRNESEYVLFTFHIESHNNDEVEFMFQEIKREAPNLENAEYWMTK
ncbi:helix-turn-helix transcriptional regulator [Vagococcus fluvialis]|uniref:helix-turn-helix transcriptional regulator n=1 Tax=Vagococcus fluvialis TaxID=2738 RepID=UPI001A901B60|nr:helix-turn-helix transcriptional regulator [Vagococcus fluvialis]MBO0437824.1 helix-turn-helix transcriptional regulator [Vagococcus fluvialis]MBO0479426.1 helix-turn-helix transcriptional regulator [Vagococcus fluvialis]MBO0484936.1 helix-turn-helix transcriptional regulator [Vagococcus fluvialis]